MKAVAGMKKYVVYLVLALFVMAVVVYISLLSSRPRRGWRIGVSQIVSHPLLDATYKGFKDRMVELGYAEGKDVTYDFQNAHGEQSVAQQIAQKFVSEKVDLIFALGTQSAQVAVKITKEIPIVYGAITDPVAAELAETLERPGGNKTGTSDRWPYEKQVALIKELVSDAKMVGIVLNPGESNTQASMEYIRLELKKSGLKWVEAPVTGTSEVLTAARSLIGRCDVFLVPADNTVIAAMDSMVKVANENQIPLFVGDTSSVEKGGIATYGNNYYEIGKASADIAVQILRDKKFPGSIPIGLGEEVELVINLKAAKKQSVEIPKDIKDKAKRIIK